MQTNGWVFRMGTKVVQNVLAPVKDLILLTDVAILH